MNNKDNNKKTSIFIPITWMITTSIWTVTAFMNLNKVGVSFWLVILQGVAALTSFIAAIANYVRYKES